MSSVFPILLAKVTSIFTCETYKIHWQLGPFRNHQIGFVAHVSVGLAVYRFTAPNAKPQGNWIIFPAKATRLDLFFEATKS